MILTATIRSDDGQALGILVLQPKTFKSGKAGFFGQGKIEIGSQRYQAQGQLVLIQSKAEPEQSPAGA